MKELNPNQVEAIQRMIDHNKENNHPVILVEQITNNVLIFHFSEWSSTYTISNLGKISNTSGKTVYRKY